MRNAPQQQQQLISVIQLRNIREETDADAASRTSYGWMAMSFHTCRCNPADIMRKFFHHQTGAAAAHLFSFYFHLTGIEAPEWAGGAINTRRPASSNGPGLFRFVFFNQCRADVIVEGHKAALGGCARAPFDRYDDDPPPPPWRPSF